MNDRRRKKSWREVDRGKDQSKHRRVARPGTDPYAHRRNTSYKAELNRFFDRGVASDRIKHQIGKAGSAADSSAVVENPERLKLIRKVSAAETFDEFVQSVDALRDDEQGLPNDTEVLVRVLEHPQDETVRDALNRLMEVAVRTDLTTLKSIRARIDSLEGISEDAETLELVAKLRQKLFG